MSLVRYKIGDILQLDSCSCGREGLIPKIKRRIEDKIRTIDGVKYPGEIIMLTLEGIEIFPWSEHSGNLRPGCGLICAKKSTLLSLGGYKEIFTGWGWEDQDLLIRAKLLGIKIATDGKVIHLSHDDTKRNQYCNNFPPSQTRNRNIAASLSSLSQGVLLGDLQVKTLNQHKPYTITV